jgi:hypothetical protein
MSRSLATLIEYIDYPVTIFLLPMKDADMPSDKGWFKSLKRGPKICLIAILVLILLLLVIVPFAYFVLIPNAIQGMINQVGGNKLTLESFSIDQFASESIDIGMRLVIPAMFPIGIKVGFGPMNVQVFDLDSKPIATTTVPPFNFYPNSEIDVSINSTVAFSKENLKNIAELLKKLHVGVENMKLEISIVTAIKLGDFQLYSAIPLKRIVEMGEFRTEIGSSVRALNRIAEALSPKSFASTGDILGQKFSRNDIFRFADSLSVVWSEWHFNGYSDGIGTRLFLEVENGTPFVMTTLYNSSAFVQIEGITVGYFEVEKVQFPNAYGVIEIDARIYLDHPTVPLENLKKAVESGSRNLAQKGDVVLSIAGPVKVKGAEFVEKATSNLKFDLPIMTLLRLGSNTISAVFKDIGVQIENILSNSTVGLQITSKKISIPSEISLPNLAPIPRSFVFPFASSFSVVGPTSPLFGFEIQPLTFHRNDERLQLTSTGTIEPTNSELAATELSTAVNSMFDLNDGRVNVIHTGTVFRTL